MKDKLQLTNTGVSLRIRPHVYTKFLLCFLLIACVSLPSQLSSQDQSVTTGNSKIITGNVTDNLGAPIIGASIMLNGTTTGTTTDQKGDFKISAPADGVLTFNFLGYATQQVTVGSQTHISVVLSEDLESLEEIVVVGYGTQKRASVTGAVATVKSEELTIAPVASATNALAGRLPGLITKQQSGLPGSDGATLSIRGFDSPLIIIDGVEGDLNAIDANEIESISVLKDGSAAIYGARAGNGVILVTTKRGVSSKPIITINSTLTFQQPTNLMKMVNSGQYAEMIREEHLQSGKPEETVRFTEDAVKKYYSGTDPDFPNTDWVSYLTRKSAPQQQHNISLRGGSEKIKYYGFFGYLNQESIIKRGGGNYGRYNVRSNIDASILDNLTMTIDISTIINQSRFPWRGDEGGDSVWQDMWNTEPIYAATLPDPSKIAYADGGGTGGAHITSNRNLSGGRDTDSQTIKAMASLRYDFKQIKGLSAKAMFNYDKWYSKNKTFMTVPDTYLYSYATDTYTKQAAGIATNLYQSASDGRTITGQVSLNYDRTFAKDHAVSALALYEVIDYGDSWLSGSRSGFETTTIRYLFAGGLKDQQANGSASEMGRASLVGRVNYAYKSKYLIESTIRYDASAKFAKSYRWGLFPSVSLGWRISEESFLKENNSVVNNLKLRASYSKTGNDNVANFNYLAGYRPGDSYVIGSAATTGLAATGIANPLLSWEDMTIYNVGLDYALFNNQLYGEADVFYRLRDGIPGKRTISLPSTFGAILPEENLNSISTKGFEFTLGYKGNTGDFKYNVSGNVSWSRSKWDFFDEPEYTDEDQRRINQKTGTWIDRTFGYRSNGLFTSQEQINNLNYKYDETQGNNSLKQGDVHYLNMNGDNLLDWRDQVEIGKGTMPHWIVGMNINLDYKRFDLSALFQGGLGFSHHLVLRQMKVFPEVMYNERWTYDNNNPNALVPRLGGASTNSALSDYNLIKGDYLRLKVLSLGYTLPQRWLDKVKIENLRIYVAGTNLFTISELQKYSIDPEAPSGMGGYYYPQTRTITFGISLSL